MRQIDLTQLLEKRSGSRVSYSTLYLNNNWTGFASSIGISFVRALKKGGLRVHKTGAVRWYFGGSQTLSKAVSTARGRYGIKLPVKGWEKVRVKTYNTTNAEEVVLKLKEHGKA